MEISTFDIFKVGIGPSSSHTVGPMRAGLDFITRITKSNKLQDVNIVKIDLYGSLALTKSGHGTDIALQLGLSGFAPDTVNPNKVGDIINNIKDTGKINLNQKHLIKFDDDSDILTHKTEELPYHPNGLIITALDKNKNVLFKEEYYSVGGGFIETREQMENKQGKGKIEQESRFIHKFFSWKELADICKKENKEVWQIMLENEKTLRSEEEIDAKIRTLYRVMRKGVKNGLKRTGDIAGGLDLKRRSAILQQNIEKDKNNPLHIMDEILLWGMAMSEENASYGRVITAPTNGAAGVIPSVLYYYKEYCNANFLGVKKFFLTAGAVGILCKNNASISGAEGGCQAEIGSATAMAAAGLTAALGGTTEQCENAAIIGLSHNLGLICDPVGGLVQVPCIERNAINAVKAVSATRLALLENGSNYLTLDEVILTLKEVGDDMLSIYRETALGGLAKNAPHGRQCIGNCHKCEFCS